MNLWTLKRKSKQALPFVRKYFAGYGIKIFVAKPLDNYHGATVVCLNPRHWIEFLRKRKAIKYLRTCDCKYHPLAGTPMVGWTSGYEEPEWEEVCAYSYLREQSIWGRPKDCTDADWKKIMRITGTTQKHLDDVDAWIKEGMGY